ADVSLDDGDIRLVERAQSALLSRWDDYVPGGGIPVQHQPVLVARRSETVPTQSEVERQAAVHLKRILHEQAQFAVPQRAIREGIEARTGERKPQQEVRVAISRERSVEAELTVGPLRDETAEA